MKIKSVLAGLFLAIIICLCSCGGNSKSESNVSTGSETTIQKLKSNAESMNLTCPQQQANGIVLESVVFEDNIFQYNYLVQGETFYMSADDPKAKEQIKNAYRADATSKPFVNALIETNSKMIFHYRTNGGKTMDIVLTPNELSSIFE